ncbi:hypothetical protein HIM_12237 [Hirsutella minnesotensis 3608]|uniref:Uncharacterized protein n=1 Tax=Hirsutella minnesotensis 3608 TaxID=1043627 RepID=A0A0F7ZI93_9HYPO|nr:hypothetical protein HIM_12237 [Hirsutella minnesotensis 3608]
MPLTVDEAWLLINDAAKSLESCQLLSARKQRRVLHAIGTLKASPPEVVDPHQRCSPSMQKRRKFYGFLLMVFHTCGPFGVLIAAVALNQTNVSGMTNDHRNALCQKLASHKDWQPPTSPHLQSFAAQLRALKPVDGTQEQRNSERARGEPSESVHIDGHGMDQIVEGQQSRDTAQITGQAVDLSPKALAKRCAHQASNTTCFNPNETRHKPWRDEPQPWNTVVPSHHEEGEEKDLHSTSQEREDLIHKTLRVLESVGQAKVKVIVADANGRTVQSIPAEVARIIVILNAERQRVLAVIHRDRKVATIYSSPSTATQQITETANEFCRNCITAPSAITLDSVQYVVPENITNNSRDSQIGNGTLAICVFCDVFGIVPARPHSTAWSRLLTNLPMPLDTGCLERNTLTEADVAILLCSFEELSQGTLKVVHRDEPMPDNQEATHFKGSTVLHPLKTDSGWAIIVTRSNQGTATILISAEYMRATASEYARQIFPVSTLLQEVHHPLMDSYDLCLLIEAFSIVLDIEVTAPIDQNLWRNLFWYLQVSQTLKDIVPKQPSPPSMSSTRHIVWVGIPTGPETIKHNPYLHVPICFKDLEIFEEVNSPFQAVSKSLVGDLKDKIGPWFLEYDNDEARNVVFIHQSVLMMLFAARLSGATVEFCNWESDKKTLMHRVQSSNHDQVLLFISDTSCDETVEDLYRATDYLEAVRANLKVYPKKSEWSWCQQKVGDIRILDDVAQQSNAWRPKTCFGMGECVLTQQQSGQMVLKRSHSCAGKQVQVVSMTRRDKLLCTAPAPKQAAGRVKRSRYRGIRTHRFLYFHQEYVPTFRRTGEFRVWVCGGRVVCAFRTKDDETLPGKPMALRQLDINDYSDFNWYSPDKGSRRRKHDELLQFVLDTDSRIRRLRNDSFDTLQIGARYDCGITPDHRFYVNELTRFTNADTFSGLLAPPHDQIIGPLAKMIAQELLT